MLGDASYATGKKNTEQNKAESWRLDKRLAYLLLMLNFGWFCDCMLYTAKSPG